MIQRTKIHIENVVFPPNLRRLVPLNRKTRLWPTIVQAIHTFSVKVHKLVNKLTLFLPSYLGFTVGCMSVRVVLITQNAQLPKVHRK